MTENNDKEYRIGHGASYPYMQNPYIVQKGWQCPLCNIIHAPSVLSCDCAFKSKNRIKLDKKT